MICLNNWRMTILIVCFPLVYSQAVLELSEKKPYTCKQEISMTCNITGVACCTGFTRFWRKDNNLIMTNGVETVKSGKYLETVNSADQNFVLTITDFKEVDSGQEFTCSYQAYTSPVIKFDSENILCAPCYRCGGLCFLWSTIGMLIGGLQLCLFYLLCFKCCNFCCYTRKYLCFKFERKDDYNYKFYGKEYQREQVNVLKTVGTAICVTSVVCVIFFGITSALLGLYCPVTKICYYNFEYYTMFFGCGTISFIVIIQLTLESFVDDTRSGCVKWGRYSLLVASTVLVIPIIIMIIYFLYTGNKEDDPTGGKSQSVESGSSCWPICRVGQDPNTASSDPDKVRRSPPKKRKSEKKKDEKPTEVVRPLPPKAQHLKTDNKERTAYSDENETFSVGLDKGVATRPLPSIGQLSSSPRRPLPQMPTGPQQEKGGNKLEPLLVVSDSSPEKKRTKKRKKKETKQTEKDNSTDF